MAAPTEPTSKIPEWLVAQEFEEILRANVEGYLKTKNFKAYPAMAPGENYATLMLRVEIEVELKEDKTKSLTYMLKIPTGNALMQEMLETHNIFTIERDMYLEVVPEMEQLLRDAGVEVKFGAKCYQLTHKESRNSVLLEDLRPYGFKNANRLEGLDMDHAKCVLKKLAQWHAASATRVATRGPYSEILMMGYFKEDNRAVMDMMLQSSMAPFNKCMETYAGNEEYKEAVLKLQSCYTDEVLKSNKYDNNEFNVLNHGDCWSNNIMFQYDAFGKIKETYLVDYQIPKYGTPAQDLYYFIISSMRYELKLDQFDVLIKFYYDQLLEHLLLLKYPKKIPKLVDLQMMLYKYGLWGFATATSTMGAVLLDPTDNASIDTFLGDDTAGINFKIAMYSNPRYRKHIEAILPWLHNRGALECSIKSSQ